VRVLAVHGVLPEEREREQPFEFDLCVHFDMSASAASDNLDDTIDYSPIVGAAVDVMHGPPCNLIERLATQIGEAILALDQRITSVDVALRKTRPPVAHDFAWAGVRLTVTR
jgi:dihydroneopterin aldolase